MKDLNKHFYNLVDGERYVPVVIHCATAISDNQTPCPGFLRQKYFTEQSPKDSRPGRISSTSDVMLAPFPSRKGVKIRSKIIFEGYGDELVISQLDEKRIFDDHPIENVERFPLDKMATINERVKETGAYTFVVEKEKAILEAVKKIPKVSEEAFRVASLMKYEIDTSKSAGSKLNLLVSFLDLPYCIPIYDSRYVDGMGMFVALYFPEISEEKQTLFIKHIYAVVLSHHKENVLTIDGGSEVNAYEPIPSGLTDLFLSTVKQKPEKEKSIASDSAGASGPKVGWIQKDEIEIKSSLKAGWKPDWAAIKFKKGFGGGAVKVPSKDQAVEEELKSVPSKRSIVEEVVELKRAEIEASMKPKEDRLSEMLKGQVFNKETIKEELKMIDAETTKRRYTYYGSSGGGDYSGYTTNMTYSLDTATGEVSISTSDDEGR